LDVELYYKIIVISKRTTYNPKHRFEVFIETIGDGYRLKEAFYSLNLILTIIVRLKSELLVNGSGIFVQKAVKINS